ncbi:arylsulfatase [Thermogutta sp.]|uniref:arylsulfatase n=2 Tax=Thermogutta sp. TaxID=1962930 RepID=UPI003C7DB2AB
MLLAIALTHRIPYAVCAGAETINSPADKLPAAGHPPKFAHVTEPATPGESTATAAATSELRERLPNIVLILADDLGYGEVGCYGQKKIHTPHLDRMAAEGMRFTQFYAGAPVCAPSRCVLLTGKHLGHAAIRDNSEVQPEGQWPLPAEEITIAELLKKRGYVTAAIGKWGLGPPHSGGDPNAQGFDFFFGYNCQRHAHNHYPSWLYRNHEKVILNNPDFPAHQRFPSDLDPHDPAAFLRYSGQEYAPDRMLEEALHFIRQNKDRPFFLYFATTLTHLALQVPQDSLDEYLGRFPETPYLGDRGYLPCFAPRATYAAMVSRLDRHVGMLIDEIKKLGLARDTLVLFTSDNGPTHGRGGGTQEGVGGSDSVFFESAGPFRGLKGSVFEGGLRVPMIAWWPEHIPAGSVSDHVAAFYDILPTFAELVSVDVPPGVDGISFLPTLLGHPQKQQNHDYLVWEFYGYGGQQAVRFGPWKAVRQQCYKDPDGPLMLFNLESDPGEQVDLAGRHPELVTRAKNILEKEHRESPFWDFRLKRRGPPKVIEAAIAP